MLSIRNMTIGETDNDFYNFCFYLFIWAGTTILTYLGLWYNHYSPSISLKYLILQDISGQCPTLKTLIQNYLLCSEYNWNIELDIPALYLIGYFWCPSGKFLVLVSSFQVLVYITDLLVWSPHIVCRWQDQMLNYYMYYCAYPEGFGLSL